MVIMNKEIVWNIVNSLLAGGLVFLGGCSTGNITEETLIFSLIAGLTAAIVQFKDFWADEKPKNKKGVLFKFI